MTKEQKKATFLNDLLGGANQKPGQGKYHSGESGQTELLFILLTFCLLSLMVLFSYRMIHYYKMGQQRENAYLCLKSSFDIHISTKEKIQYANYAISAALAAIVASLGSATVQAKKTIDLIKKLQLFLVIKSFYNIYSDKNCTLEQKLILISFTPISMNWKTMSIKRTLGTLADFKTKRRKFFYPSQSIKDSDFFIKAEVHYLSGLKLKKSKEYELQLLPPINQAELKAMARSTFSDFKAFFTNPKDLILSLLELAL